MPAELIGRFFYHPVKLVVVVVDFTLITDADVLLAYIRHSFTYKIKPPCGCCKCEISAYSRWPVAPMADFKAFGENLLDLNACPGFYAWPSYLIIARITERKAKNMADKMGAVGIAVFCITVIAKILDMLANK
jgi:hypothetical protein